MGNIYLGGTGKTPLTIKIFKILETLNKRVATVKKNYSSQKDEQLLLKQKTSLIIVNSRKNAFEEGLKHNYDTLIFDDGLQEMQIDFDNSAIKAHKKVCAFSPKPGAWFIIDSCKYKIFDT